MTDVNLSLSKEVVQPIIEAKIHAAVLEALGGDDISGMLEQIIKMALMVKVGRDGKRSTYDNNHTLVGAMCIKAIESATREALAEWTEENKAQIKTSFRKVLAKSPDKMTRAFVAGITEAAVNQYRMTVRVELPEE